MTNEDIINAWVQLYKQYEFLCTEMLKEDRKSNLQGILFLSSQMHDLCQILRQQEDSINLITELRLRTTRNNNGH